MSRVRRSILFVLVLSLGVVGGLVVSGRMSLTQPSAADPLQATATTTAPRTASSGAAAASATGTLPDLSAIAEAALKVSVNISSTSVVRVPVDPILQWFYGMGDQTQRSQSLGSGVIVSPDGYVLTNNHVIGNAAAEIRVTLPNGKELPGKLIGVDRVSDLAVVKVATSGQPTLPWGDSSKLRVAQWVLAIGNPFQLSGTVTLGIISTVSRSGADVGSVSNFIQTDAAINPGNSGGALVDARGDLVGINSMIYSETGGYQGIGFAIPSNLARRIMTDLIHNGSVSWGSIGDISWVTIDPQTAAQNGITVTGAYVRFINRNAPAAQAGLERGDIVVSINGQKVTDQGQIDRVVTQAKIGSTVKLGVVKWNGRSVTLTVPVVARQDQLPAARRTM